MLGVSQWDLLAEDAGAMFGTGVKIPEGASILGVRYTIDVQRDSGNTPTYEMYHGAGGTTEMVAGASFFSGAQVIHAGYGTLASGADHNLGDIYFGNNLATEAGQAGARSRLTDTNLTFGFRAINGVGVDTMSVYVDFMRVEVAWVLRVDRPGGAFAPGLGGSGLATMQATPPGGAVAAGVGGASPRATASRGESGAAAAGVAGAPAKPMKTGNGGARSTGGTAGAPTVVYAGSVAGAVGGALGGGEGRVFSYAIAGYSRNGATGATIPNVRVDVYRTRDHAHMGRVASDVNGAYTVAIPYTENSMETFWARFREDGSPARLATTDEDLTLIESLIAGPPL